MTSNPKQGAGLSAAVDKHAYRILGGAAIGVILLGTVVYHWLEDWSWVDSLYFSVVAGTTVGFGDLAPTTDGSKLFTIFYIITGFSIIATFLNLRFRVHSVVGARMVHGSDEDDEDDG